MSLSIFDLQIDTSSENSGVVTSLAFVVTLPSLCNVAADVVSVTVMLTNTSKT